MMMLRILLDVDALVRTSTPIEFKVAITKIASLSWGSAKLWEVKTTKTYLFGS